MASLLIDLENTTQQTMSVGLADGVGNVPASGVIVGVIGDFNNTDSNCNMQVLGGPISGPFFVKVQTSDQTTSGSFTDPTSGLAVMPSQFLSGGRLCVNSGIGYGSGNLNLPFAVGSGNPIFCSGGTFGASFQRPQAGRYVRAIVESGSAVVQHVYVNFVSQLIATGSGGGTSMLPTSGGVSV